METSSIKIYNVRCGNQIVRTADNPYNTFVRSLDDGKWYRTGN